MASNHEVQIDGLVHTCEHSPHEVLHYGVIFVLTTTVVSMQTDGGFVEAIMPKKEVQHTGNCVRPLPCITGLINNEVHLSGNGFAADPLVLKNRLDQAAAGCWDNAPAAQNQRNNVP